MTSLREYRKRVGDNDQRINVGDVVQLHEDKYPRNRWIIGVIDSLIYSKDVLVRAAVVRSKHGLQSRPIVKLYPLEMCDYTPQMDDQQPGTSGLQRRVPVREAAVCTRRNIHDWT